MLHRLIDIGFARYAARRPMFLDGWGDQRLLERFDPRWIEQRVGTVCEVGWGPATDGRHGRVRDGSFDSSCEDLPDGAKVAHVRHVGSPGNDAACILLAGSREEKTTMREAVYGPLVARGIDLFVLENPYYGTRRPLGARDASVLTVADQIRMNVATLLEALSLLQWMRERYRRIGVAGYSMGGHMAALAGVLFGQPLAIGAFATGACPAPIYTAGLLSRSVAFSRLGSDERAERTRLRELFERADLTRLPPPAHPPSASLVAMAHDGYVSRTETERLAAHWRGATVRFEDAGHVSGIVLRREELRRALERAFLALDPTATPT